MRFRFATRAGPCALLLLMLAGCGAPDGALTLSMSQALDDDVTTLGVRVFGSVVTCRGLTFDPASSLAAPPCGGSLTGSRGCTHDSVDVDRNDVQAGGVDLHLGEGTRYVFAAGLDDSGTVLGSACNGPLEIRAGEITRIRMRLE